MRALFVLLALVAAWVVLGALHVVALPFGLLAREDAAAPGAGSAGHAPPPEAAGERQTPAAGPVARAVPPVRAEVRGTEPRGAVIRGRIVAGADAPTPVAGATVRLSRPHAITTFLKTPAAGRWDVLEVRTGADGRFAFLEVRPNRGYVVRARLGDRRTVSSRYVDVVGRQVLDLGDLAEGKEASLSGRVVGGGGEPLAGVRVAVAWSVQSIFNLVVPDPDLLPETEASTTTGADGRFRLAPLEPGRKTLVVLHPEQGGTVRSHVEVEADTVLPTDVKLGAAGVVAGRVEWEDGRPAAGADVFAFDVRAMGGALFTTPARADGSFRFEHLVGDVAWFGVYREGIAGEPSDRIRMGTVDVVLKLPDLGAVKGRVVRRSDDQRIERFHVRLEPQGSEHPLSKILRVSMDQVVGTQGFTTRDGKFTLPAVARGTYVAVVSAAGFPDTRSAPFEVPAAGTGDAGTIQLPDGHVLGGTVRFTSGERLPGASLRLVAEGGAPSAVDEQIRLALGETDEGMPDAYVDAEGRFTLPPQTPGTYVLSVRHRFAEDHEERAIDLTSGPRTDLDVRVKPAGCVRVRVLDAAEQPVRGEQVALVREDGLRRLGRSDARGEVLFESVRLGGCLLRWTDARPRGPLEDFWEARDAAARAQAYEALRADSRAHEVRGGITGEAVVRLPPRTRVKVRIEPWAKEVESIQLVRFLGGPDGKENLWFVADTPVPGGFEILLEPGSYVVQALPQPGGWEAVKRFPGVVIPDADTHTLDLTR